MVAWELYRVIHVALPLGITQFPLNGYSFHCNGVHSKTTLSLFARLKSCFLFDSFFLVILFTVLSFYPFFSAHACPFLIIHCLSRYFSQPLVISVRILSILIFFTFLVPVDVFHLLSFKRYSN